MHASRSQVRALIIQKRAFPLLGQHECIYTSILFKVQACSALFYVYGNEYFIFKYYHVYFLCPVPIKPANEIHVYIAKIQPHRQVVLISRATCTRYNPIVEQLQSSATAYSNMQNIFEQCVLKSNVYTMYSLQATKTIY